MCETKTIIYLFTNFYPYVNGGEDVFVEPEVIELSKRFDEMVVVPLDKKIQQPILVECDNVTVDTTLQELLEKSKHQHLFKKIRKIANFTTLKAIPWTRVSKDTRTIKTSYALLGFLYRVQIIKSWIRKKVKQDSQVSVVCYSFWLYDAALAVSLAKSKGANILSISRAHGFDLYEERSGYFPLRKYLIKSLDRLFTVSEHGRDYLLALYPDCKNKIITRYLGSAAPRTLSPKSLDGCIRVLSIANMVSVKRLDLLALAMIELAKKTTQNVIWTHYGSGPMFQTVNKLVRNADVENLEVNLKGHISNKELLKSVQNSRYDVFLNTSESEGLPVSIMEASSLGIPTVATDVGGVKEIVEKCGRLIPKTATPKMIAETVLELITSEKYDDTRIITRKIWIERFDAAVNARNFSEEVKHLVS